MAAPSLRSSNVVREAYRGWQLYVRWYPSFAVAAEGWVCYPVEPGSTWRQSVSLGRQRSSADALEQGRRFVDGRLDAPARPRRGRPAAR